MDRKEPYALENIPTDISETSDVSTDITGQEYQRTEGRKQGSLLRFAMHFYSTYSTKMFIGPLSMTPMSSDMALVTNTEGKQGQDKGHMHPYVA